MLRMNVAVKEADNQCGGGFSAQPMRCCTDFSKVQGTQDGAACQDALVHFYYMPAIDQRRGLERLDVVKDGAVGPGDFDRILEAAGGDQPDRRPLALEYGICSDCDA